MFNSSDLISQIKEYQEKHSVLSLKSHHFVFDCPFDSEAIETPDFIWIGLNPGGDQDDWAKTDGKNDEETRDRNFQEIYGRSSLSKRRMTKVRNFLGNNNFRKTTHTELFFWCSKDTNKDFQNRYNFSFDDNPHMKFCCQMNKILIDRIKPKALFFESRAKIDIIKRYFRLDYITTEVISNSDNVRVDEYSFESKYRLINFDHLSAGPPKSLHMQNVSKYVQSIIN